MRTIEAVCKCSDSTQHILIISRDTVSVLDTVGVGYRIVKRGKSDGDYTISLVGRKSVLLQSKDGTRPTVDTLIKHVMDSDDACALRDWKFIGALLEYPGSSIYERGNLENNGRYTLHFDRKC